MPRATHSAPAVPASARLLVVALVVLGSPLLGACSGDQEIERPSPLYGEVPIRYPLELWDQDVEGETLLKVRVTDTGRVDSIVVAESSGHPAFDSAAIEGARDLRFRPARKNGKRIEIWAEVPVHFSKRPRSERF